MTQLLTVREVAQILKVLRGHRLQHGEAQADQRGAHRQRETTSDPLSVRDAGEVDRKELTLIDPFQINRFSLPQKKGEAIIGRLFSLHARSTPHKAEVETTQFPPNGLHTGCTISAQVVGVV